MFNVITNFGNQHIDISICSPEMLSAISSRQTQTDATTLDTEVADGSCVEACNELIALFVAFLSGLMCKLDFSMNVLSILEKMNGPLPDFMIPIENESEMWKNKTEIASKLGILSLKGIPHARAVGAIIDQLQIDDWHHRSFMYKRNGKYLFIELYSSTVVAMIAAWLIDRGDPTEFEHDGTTYQIKRKTIATEDYNH